MPGYLPCSVAVGSQAVSLFFQSNRATPYSKAVGYDPMLSRFTSPDSIIPEPGSVIGYNRYAYVNNNPIRYTDPSGYCISEDGSILAEYPFGSSGLCNGPHYDGEKGWRWATDNDGVNDPSTDGRDDTYDQKKYEDKNDCTIFASFCMHASGLPYTDEWNQNIGDDSAWAETVQFYHYLTDDDKNNFMYVVLPVYPKGGTMMSSSEIEAWFDEHVIPAGSIAFYNTDVVHPITKEKIEYMHAAIVGPDVIEFDEIDNVPLITDINGGSTKPRAVLDTYTYNNDRNNDGVNPYVITFVILP